MSLTQEQIEKLLSSLSKLWRNNSEKLTSSVNSIIKYMDILNEVDTTNVQPTVSVVQKQNILRKDEETDKESTPTELLDCSDQKVIANQIALPNIMK